MSTPIWRSTKGRIYASESVYKQIDHTLNCCRFIYNHMIDRSNKVYDRRGEHLAYNDMQNLLPKMKKYLPWLKEADSQALTNACRRVDAAYQSYFKHRTGRPRFHSKRGRQSYTTTNSKTIKVCDGQVWIPKLGWIKVRGMRNLPQNAGICYATISREPDGKYYVSVTYKYEMDIETPEFDENSFIGIDYRAGGLYVDSNGNEAKVPRWFSESQAKLKREQQRLSRKVGSQNGERKSNSFIKQQRKVARINKKITNQRIDYLHKLSAELARSTSGVAAEDINIKALPSEIALNGRSDLQNGYGMLREMLKYKLEAQGKPYVEVDRFYPSNRTCSRCGFVNDDSKSLSKRKWECPKCGAIHDRNTNAAKNIRREGLRMISESEAAS